MEFKDKVVIITGASGGIGKETVKMFAAQGAKLTLVDVNREELIKIANEIGLAPDNCILLLSDVAIEEQVKNYVDQTKQKFGRIDVFVNNAGIEGKVASIVETDKENLDKVLNINIKGVFYGLKHVMKVMMEQKSGSIINTASVAGFIGSPGLSAYVASKHAVLGLTKTAALEGADFGIRVNAVCPGPVDNRMMRSIEDGANPGNGNAVKDAFLANIPLKKYSTNEEVANLIYFLASDKSSSITGTAYRIDGGMGAK